MEVVNPPQNHKTVLPNSGTTLVLGILSLIFGCGILGLALGIIGLFISRDAKNMYDENPDAYLGYSTLNAGRILCIIGIVIGGTSLIVLFLWILGISAVLGTLFGVIGL